MHRVLKQETANPPAEDRPKQQKRFDEFRRVYNFERPHEPLDGDYPAAHYRASTRPYPERLRELQYSAGFELHKADVSGKFRWKQARCKLGEPLKHQVTGAEAVEDGVQRIWFGPVLPGLLDERKGYRQAASKGGAVDRLFSRLTGSLGGVQLLIMKCTTRQQMCNRFG